MVQINVSKINNQATLAFLLDPLSFKRVKRRALEITD